MHGSLVLEIESYRHSRMIHFTCTFLNYIYIYIFMHILTPKKVVANVCLLTLNILN